MGFRIGFAAAICLLAYGGAWADDAQPITIDTRETALAATLDLEFQDALKSGVNGAVLLEQDGKVTLRAGYGYANREQKIPFTTKTIAQIGSITKQFTAMALIDLWHQGEIDFAKPVKAYLPQTAEPVASVTLDQLLTHTSGMPEYCGDDFARQSKATLLAKCAATPLQFPPGTKFFYSNPEYSILAAIVEQVGGEPIDAYLKDRFFKRLGMNDTGYDFPGTPRDRFAAGYLDGKPQGVIDQTFAPLAGDYWNLKGNGGMQASTEDMYRWYRALSGGDAIPQAMRETAFKPRFHEDHDVWEAYGWNAREAPDGHVVQVSHSGSDGTFFSYFCWRPDDRTFFYMVSNTGDKPATALVKRIVTSLRDYGKMPVTDMH
ncbi:MAG TPA: serine hydrolase domain-containing protein [Rhizomicrobium sp.]|jgi:CubicO group peptidase (beta-lactamase class C family)